MVIKMLQFEILRTVSYWPYPNYGRIFCRFWDIRH